MKPFLDVWDRLDHVSWEQNYDRTVYVYRLDSMGQPIKPYLIKLFADRDLLNTLRDDFGGGKFRLLIREGRKMVFSGEISIVAQPNRNLGVE